MDKKNQQNGHRPATEIEPSVPITSLFQEATAPTADVVQHLEKLVDAMMTTDNMRLRTNIPPRLLVHVIRAELFAQYCEEHNFDNTAKRMRDFRDYLLQLSVGVKGWGTENLIKALQAARAPMYQFGDNNGMKDRMARILGR